MGQVNKGSRNTYLAAMQYHMPSDIERRGRGGV